MLKQLDAAIQNYHSTYAAPKRPEAAAGRGNPDEN
jgi:hypothetical protein